MQERIREEVSYDNPFIKIECIDTKTGMVYQRVRFHQSKLNIFVAKVLLIQELIEEEK